MFYMWSLLTMTMIDVCQNHANHASVFATWAACIDDVLYGRFIWILLDHLLTNLHGVVVRVYEMNINASYSFPSK